MDVLAYFKRKWIRLPTKMEKGNTFRKRWDTEVKILQESKAVSEKERKFLEQ